MTWSVTSLPGKTVARFDGKRGDLFAIRIDTKKDGDTQGLFAGGDSSPAWIDIESFEELRVIDTRPQNS